MTTASNTIAANVRRDSKRAGTQGNLHDVYERLRQDILSGLIPPGATLNQVHIAKRFNVSRTPVREALRMLQAEGLAEPHFQHRIRVTVVTPQEIDEAYAMWFLLDSLAVALTVPRLTSAELVKLRIALDDMNQSAPTRSGSPADWAARHIVFHRLLIVYAGDNIAAAIENCRASTERARRIFMRVEPQSWLASEEEHNALVKAYEDRSVERAIALMSRQLSRIALAVLGNIDPRYEPVAMRHALNVVERQHNLGFDTMGLPEPGVSALQTDAPIARKRRVRTASA